jgi:hypothetical protein
MEHLHQTIEAVQAPSRIKMWLYVIVVLLIPTEHFWPANYNWCDIVIFVLKVIGLVFIIYRNFKKRNK